MIIARPIWKKLGKKARIRVLFLEQEIRKRENEIRKIDKELKKYED